MAGLIYRKFNRFMVKWFGRSWRTSLYGVLALLPQAAKPILDYLTAMGAPSVALNTVSFVFALLFALAAKDRDVTGGNRP